MVLSKSAVARTAWQIALAAAAFLAAAALGFAWVLPATDSALVWPAAAVALVAVWRWAARGAAGVAVGAVLLGLDFGLPLLVAVPAAITKVLPAILAVGVLRHLGAGLDGGLGRPKSVLQFLVVAALIAPAVSAGGGALMRLAAGRLADDELVPVLLTWWIGDSLGVALFAPFLLQVLSRSVPRVRSVDMAEGCAVAAVLAAICGLAFNGSIVPSAVTLAAPMVLVPVVWAGLRLPPPLPAATIALVGLVLLVPPWHEAGPDGGIGSLAPLLAMQAHLLAVAVTGLLVQSVRAEGIRLTDDLVDLRTVVAQSPTGIARVDPSGQVRSANAAFSRLLGHTAPAGMVGRPLPDGLAQACGPAAATDEAGAVSYLRWPQPDGEHKILGLRCFEVQDSDGTRAGRGLFLADVTARAAAEHAARQASMRADLALDAAGMATWQWFCDDGSIEVSGRWYTILNRPVGSAPCTLPGLLALVHQDDREAMATALATARDAGQSFMLDARVVAGSGDWLWMRISGARVDTDPPDSRAIVAGVARDITAERAVAARDRDRLTLYTSMFFGTPAVQMLIDPETLRFSDVNGAAARFYGVPRDQLIGLPVTRVVADDPGHITTWLASHDGAGGCRVPAHHRIADGSVRDVIVLSSKVAVAGHRHIHAIVIDVSAERLLAEDLRRKVAELDLARTAAEAASHAKSEFIAAMSHELRTPLNPILGFAEVIRDRMMGDSAVELYAAYADDIHRSATHLLALVGSLLDLARIDAGRTDLQEEPLDIADICHATLRLLRGRAGEKNQGLTLANECPDAMIQADERMVRQMLLNIVSNAVAFTPDEGHISIRIVGSDAGGVDVMVVDTGPGIPPDILSRLGEPFVRRGAAYVAAEAGSGLGLGLALVNRMMILHGGALVIDSTVGTGATVILRFPAERVRCTGREHTTESGSAPPV